MKSVGIHEAKTHLSRLIKDVMAGEEITIRRGDQPVARLVPVAPERRERVPGRDRGLFVVPEDFDAPLPADVLDQFET